MIMLLAAGIGVCIVGLLAIGFGIPISDTSVGNALLIAGVVILCTGIVLLGMWLVARELSNLTKLVLGQGVQPARQAPSPRPATASPPASAHVAPVAAHPATDAPPATPPWADEVAARNKPQVAVPEVQPIAPEPPPPAAPDRPARRNLLFASKRRDKEEQSAAAVPSPALEAEPKVSFDSAWPSSLRSNGAAERQEPSAAAASEPPAAEPAKPDLPPGVTVMKSGVVDGMAYTLYSDGSIEAQFAGESPIRFASFDALRAHVEQQRQ
jgi:type IV secretory pathway VirB10-like protein